jgi:DNA-binding NarL/FixJ family response regulator
MLSVGGRNSTRLIVLDDQMAVRECLCLALRMTGEFDVVGAAGQTGELVERALSVQPDLVLADVVGDAPFFHQMASLVTKCPGLAWVALDEQPNADHARLARECLASGYLTKRQGLAEIATALRRASRGETMFVPTPVRNEIPLAGSGWSALPALTQRERDVMLRLATGSTVKQCAAALRISPSTVDNHKSRLMKKLDVHKTVHLTHLALRLGLIPAVPGSEGAGAAPTDVAGADRMSFAG